MTKVAVVTGAGQGIGEGIAKRLAKDGFAIAVADINHETADRVAENLRNNGFEAKAYYLDVANRDQVFNLIDEAVKDFGELEKPFFDGLSKQLSQRSEEGKKKYSIIPYLNSSLFEQSEEEKKLMFISQLDSATKIKIYKNTILKDFNGKKMSGESNPLHYLYDFLNSYSFGS